MVNVPDGIYLILTVLLTYVSGYLQARLKRNLKEGNTAYLISLFLAYCGSIIGVFKLIIYMRY